MLCDANLVAPTASLMDVDAFSFGVNNFEFQEAVKLKPSFPDAYLNLGNVYKVSCYDLYQ